MFLGFFGSSAANCSTFLTSNSFFRSSRFMAVASPSDWSLIEYSSSSAATCGCGFGWGWGWLFHGSHSGSAVRVAVDSTGHRAGWPAEPIVELPAVDSTGHQPEPLMMKTERVVADSMGHRRQRLRNRLGLVPRVIARHIARHCLRNRRSRSLGLRLIPRVVSWLRSRLSMVPLRLIPRIIVRRLLIWLVPRVGFGRLRRR